jgi:hypothetical protein
METLFLLIKTGLDWTDIIASETKMKHAFSWNEFTHGKVNFC